MKYYTSVSLNQDFETATQTITEALSKQQFGIVSTINMHEKFKAKLQKDFRKYRILGACNPAFAYEAVQVEEHIGIMLPCNVVIQEKGKNLTEVSIVDPVASMQAIENPNLEKLASTVQKQLTEVIKSLQ